MNNTIYIRPYIRKGLGNNISEVDNLNQTITTASKRNARLIVNTKFKQVTVEDEDNKKQIEDKQFQKEIQIIGPGEITGISPQIINRTFPKHGEFEFPCNYMPYIEFTESDIPWRYTPAAANNQKLRPWLSLIICKPEECTVTKTPEGISILTINDDETYKKVFSEIVDKTWLWAHEQDEISRVVAARKLEPETAYIAFLIPTFELGRLAGLGEEITEDIPVQKSAWGDGDKKISLVFPIYHTWRFITGDASFKILAERLHPIPSDIKNNLPQDIQVDVSDMGMGIKANKTNIGVPMATTPLDYQINEFPNENESNEKETAKALNKLLSKAPVFAENKEQNTTNEKQRQDIRPNDKDDPMIVPPIYGASHIAATSLDNKNFSWFKSLNTKITNRIAAGLGVKVIQDNQEHLVNRAWEQVEEVVKANQWIRERFLGNVNNQSILKNRLSDTKNSNKTILNDNEIEEVTQQLLNLSAILETPLFDDLADGKTTIAEILEQYNYKKDFINPSMQRLLKVGAFNLEDFVNKDKSVSNAQLLKTIAENHSIIFNIDKKDGATKYSIVDLLIQYRDEIGSYCKDAAYSYLSTWHIATHFWIEAFKAGESDIFDNTEQLELIKEYLSLNEDASVLNNIFKNTNDNTGVKQIPCPFNSFYEFYECCFKEDMDFYCVIIELYNGINKFIDKYENFIHKQNQAKPNEEKPQKPNWTAIRNAINEYLEKWRINKDVDNAIKRYAAHSNVRIPEDIKSSDSKKLHSLQKPILAYPYFAEPTYYYLRKNSAKYILPAIEQIPNDTISVFKDNKRFIESFICGMNTEMGKELFWREYPTDKRGSYFEKFWDIAADKENTNGYSSDVNKQYNWKEELGRNHCDNTPLIIFAVKGALVKRYPNVEVFLSQGELKPATDRENSWKVENNISKNNIYPDLKAQIDENTILYGFKITTKQLSTIDKNRKIGGMFLNFKEHPKGISFRYDKLYIENNDNETIDAINKDSATLATEIINQPCLYAKHVSAFLCNPKK